MLKVACLVLLTVAGRGLGDEVTDGTTLVQAFLIHRHGDRTPVDSSLAMTTDPDAVAAASAPYGYGQLTDAGIRRSYKLGQYIRDRYDTLLSPHYNKSDIYIRSTDSTRTKMSVLSAMAAVYPAYQGSWSDNINWVPVPYTTVPVKYDFNQATFNCPTFITSYYSAFASDPSSMDQYADVIDTVAEYLGYDLLKTMPVLSYAIYDAFVSQEHLGVPLSPEIAAVMPRLKEAAGVAIDVLYGDATYINLMSGPLLNEFFTYASSIIAGEDTPRMRVYSAHDVNVYGFMSISQITPRQGVPKYSSAFSLELRQVEETGKYVVLAVYKPDPNEDLMYLPIADCGLLCDIDQFQEIVANYLLDEASWRTECGFSDDLVIDDSSVA